MKLILRAVILSALLMNAGMALSSTISGTVRDSEGAVVAKAQITIHRDPVRGGKGSVDVAVETDKNGQFTVSVVPGFYDLFVSASAFSPQCVKVRVNEAEPAVYDPRLHADPLVTKQYGDTF